MYEVELKVPADLERVRDRLDAIDAAHSETVEQVDTYYDAPHRSFAETDEALRVRSESAPGADDRTRLTYKGPLVEAASKTREEIETAVADGDAIGDILEQLGFEPAATVRKKRDRYAADGYTVTLDSVDDVGEFVEVEVEAAAGEIVRAREGARDVLERLGLDPDEQIRTSYLELLLE